MKDEVPFTLIELGIYKKEEWLATNGDVINRNCLVQCFRDFPDQEKYENLKTKIYGEHTRARCNYMNIICTTLEINIALKKWFPNQSRSRVVNYPPLDKPRYDITIKICLLANHYFPYIEDMGQGIYTKYITECRWKYEGRAKPNTSLKKRKPMSSNDLVFEMLCNRDKYFTDFDSALFKQVEMVNTPEEIIHESRVFDVENDCRPIREFKEGKREYSHIIHADIETTTEGKKFKPYLICAIVEETGERVKWVSEGCVCKFLNWLYKEFDKPIIKLCNLGFDIKFITAYLHKINKPIEKGNKRTYLLEGLYGEGKRKKKFTFMDQLQQIPIALREYKKYFNLEDGKMENFPYRIYTEESVKLKHIQPPKELVAKLKEIFPEEYWSTIQTGYGSEVPIIYHMRYAIDYCFQDIETQIAGWKIMRDRAKKQSGLDINNYLTMPSYAKAYFHKEGAYDGVFEVTGMTRLFKQGCIIGGRTMASLVNKENYGSYIINDDSCGEYDLTDETVSNPDGNYKWVFHPDRKYRNISLIEYIPEQRTLNQPQPQPQQNIQIEQRGDKIYILIDGKEYVVIDANSLYPSAKVEMPGYPIGKPRNLGREEIDVNLSWKPWMIITY